jgi:methionyl-tRNA synthetase
MIENISWILPLIIGIAIWEMVWKGIALWKAGTRKELGWFICIFIINTAGILPIVYLLFFSKNNKK